LLYFWRHPFLSQGIFGSGRPEGPNLNGPQTHNPANAREVLFHARNLDTNMPKARVSVVALVEELASLNEKSKAGTLPLYFPLKI
jgi:hypothetical protein